MIYLVWCFKMVVRNIVFYQDIQRGNIWYLMKQGLSYLFRVCGGIYLYLVFYIQLVLFYLDFRGKELVLGGLVLF